MATKKAQKKQAAKPKPKEAAADEKRPTRIGDDEEELVVFAFRLTEAERNAIHKAAGPGKASKFARALLVAAARNDDATVREIVKGAQA